MVEVFSVNPKGIRGLGNIVDTKTVNDFDKYLSTTSSSTDTVDGVSRTVYTTSYRQSEHITLHYNYFKAYSADLTSFTVQATLYAYGGSLLVGKSLTCTVNEELVLTGRTNSKGQVTFNIPVDGEGVYYFRVNYSVNQGTAGCSQSGRVIVGELDNILLQCQTPITSKNQEDVLFATLTGTVNDTVIPIPGTVVNFYEEYTLFNVSLNSSLGPIIQDDDVTTLTARVSDEDGSAIPGQTVHFYEEYESGSLEFTNTETAITSGDNLTLSALLRNVEGGRVQGETVNFYEEYTADSVRLTSNKRVIVDDETATLTASLRDTDGSIIRVSGTTVNFYEEYDLSNIIISSSTQVIETGDEIDVNILVTDEDGSRIPGATVKLYEEYDYSNLKVSASKNPLVDDDEITITALLTDEDGSRVRGETVDINEDIDSTDWTITSSAGSTVVESGNSVNLTTTVKDSSNNAVEGIRIRIYNIEGD